jgi:hypothetical protein
VEVPVGFLAFENPGSDKVSLEAEDRVEVQGLWRICSELPPVTMAVFS